MEAPRSFSPTSAPFGPDVPGVDHRGDNPISAGVFPGEERLDIVLVDGDVADGEVGAVTVEQAGGAETPTLPPIVASNPV